MKWEMKLREEREASEAKGMKKGLEQEKENTIVSS